MGIVFKKKSEGGVRNSVCSALKRIILVKVTRSPQNTERVMGLSLFRRVIPVFAISPFHPPPPTKT